MVRIKLQHIETAYFFVLERTGACRNLQQYATLFLSQIYPLASYKCNSGFLQQIKILLKHTLFNFNLCLYTCFRYTKFGH